MTLDLTKPVQTRSGQKALILMTDGGGCYPVLGAVQYNSEQRWEPCSWTKFGRHGFDREGRLDLVNVPGGRVCGGWVNVYEGGGGSGIHQSRAEADRLALPDRTECLHIRREYEPGEGLKKA